ncbi:cytochrome c [Glaciimonas sp. Gout2]|uniref:c-type cytochrome n=1 Tax=unclassified Glaciimonas TaxID=2644401 RepID=UPI002B22C0B9|nr:MULTISPECIES: cytochrome c [unclassified Glaciimonas]MEB0011217.1 cytochrome c [Glaciimonas sp. Cout2]MEB0084562.1 cytochrome c [Glaciimonas sp. Gout2]
MHQIFGNLVSFPRRLYSTAIAGLFVFATVAATAQDIATPSPEQVAQGAKLYAANCAVCHGGHMVDEGGGFFDLRTFPPQQRTRFITSVSNGKNSMPPWKSVLSQDEIASLFAYVVAGEK